MPKYWGKQIFAHGRFPEVGQNQKTEREKRRRKKLNDGNNNGQAMHGARRPPGPKVVHHVDMHGVDCGHYKLVA